MAARKTSRTKKKPRRAARPRWPEGSPFADPPSYSSEARDLEALDFFDAIEDLADSEVRAMAERGAALRLESFVRRLGHHLTNQVAHTSSPCAAIKKLLASPEVDRAAVAARLAQLNDAIGQVHHVIERMRDAVLSVRPHLAEERLAPLVEEARAEVVSQLGERAERFDFTADVEEGLTLHADHPYLLRTLVDLIKNGAEAYPDSKPRTPVQVTARTRGRRVEIVVSDEGYGQDAETLAVSFLLPFSTSKSRATGLGLVLARRAVEEMHGGRLTIESDGPGKGTRARLVLPRRNKAAHPRRRLTHDEMFLEVAREEREELQRAARG